jgi:hypothetical protein
MPQTGVFRDRWWRQSIRAYQTGRNRTNPKDQLPTTDATPGIQLALAPVASVSVSADATPGIALGLAPAAAPPDTAATIIDYATLGPVNGASGGSMSGHLLYAVNTGRWWFFTYGTVLASGTATGGTTQTLVDSGASFTTALNGRTVVIVAGTGAGHSFEVTRSSATTLRLQDNGDPATPYTLTFTPDATTQYRVVDSRKIRAYVSSSSDLSTATWAAATGSASGDMVNGVGVDMAGGRFDGGGFGGIYPTDGRQMMMAYANVASHDVVYTAAQTGVHWYKQANRGRITAAATIAWDNIAANTNTWDDTFGDQEALPYATQPFALAFDSNNSRWHFVWNKTQGLAGSAWTSNENGTLTTAPTWGGYLQANTFDSNTDNNGTHFPWEMGLCELGSGIMLAVYCFGNLPSSFSTTVATQTGLRFAKSASATTWSTTNTTGAAVPSLSSTANSPNDWSMVARTTTDVHVIRRNSATVIEQIRYDGTSWGSVTTLPTSGLTGHVANSGVGLVTDGTDVWCVVLDSDSSNSIKYIKWTSAGGWASSWSTLSTNGNAKAFLTVHQRVGNSQIGVAWTEGPDGSGRYSVRGAAISTTAASANASATPGIQLALAPAGTGTSLASATPGLQLALAPQATGVSLATAAPGIQLALAPAGTGVSLATSTPGIQLALAPAATSLSVATATPGIQLGLAPAGTGVSLATSTPGIQLALAPAATGVSLATAALGMQLALAPVATGASLATTTPGIQLALAPAATGISLAAATPGVQLALAPQATSVSFATAAPGIQLALAAANASGASVTATPGIALGLAPAAIGTSSATGTLGIQLALAPAAIGISPATAAPGIRLALVPIVSVSVSGQATLGITLALAAAASSPAFTDPWYRTPTDAPFIGSGITSSTNIGIGETLAVHIGAGLTSATNIGIGELTAPNIGVGETTAPNLGAGTTSSTNVGVGETSGDYLEKPGG